MAGGYNLDLGVGIADVSSTTGLGLAFSTIEFGAIGSGYSGGAFAFEAATAYAGYHIVGKPAQTSSTTYTLGAYAGAGANLFFTNAASSQQLRGPFTTLSISVGYSIVNLGVQISTGGGIWQVSVTPPLLSYGYGFAGSVVTTNTAATHTGCH